LSFLKNILFLYIYIHLIKFIPILQRFQSNNFLGDLEAGGFKRKYLECTPKEFLKRCLELGKLKMVRTNVYIFEKIIYIYIYWYRLT